MERENRERPYWHVDAKWLFGIFFTVSLFISLVTFSLVRLTSEKTIVPLASFIVASQFSQSGLDDPKDIEEFKRKNIQSGQSVFYPLTGQPVTITKQELNTLSPRQLRLRIFEQVVGPIYSQPRTEESLKELGVLAFLNFETHNLIYRIFLMSLILSFLTGLGLIAFSHGYSRFISPAVPLILLGFAPSIVLFLLQNTSSPQDNNGLFSTVPREIVMEAVSSFSLAFYIVLITGVVLIVLGTIYKIVSKK